MSDRRPPRWVLSDVWAVDTDPYNFILYQRQFSKQGKPGRWQAKGFYPTAGQLFESLLRKLARSEDQDPDLLKHLETCLERAQASAERFSTELRSEGLFQLKRPAPRPGRAL